MTRFTTNTLEGKEQHDRMTKGKSVDYEGTDDETQKAKNARIRPALGFTDEKVNGDPNGR
jgi:hypothetical protein